MQLLGKTEIIAELGDGVWQSRVSQKTLKFLPTAKSAAQGRSIIGVGEHTYDASSKTLTFDIESAVVLANGPTETSLIIAMEKKHRENIARRSDTTRPTTGAASLENSTSWTKSDKAFIKACEYEGLPANMIELAEHFLAEVRAFADDPLVEGKHRKWVTKPNNFLAITIQNTKKRFCVHVNKTSGLGGLGSLIIKDDRPGYARFWLEHAGQLDQAVKAAAWSSKV